MSNIVIRAFKSLKKELCQETALKEIEGAALCDSSRISYVKNTYKIKKARFY